MIFLGIDPGLDGGLAFLDDKGKLSLHKTPVIGGRDYDIQEMKRLLQFHPMLGGGIFVIIENQISMPGQGLTSTLQTGKGFGIWLGLLSALEIPFQVVSSRQWQSKLYTGVSAKLETKEKSIIVAKRLFPTADFRKSERATVANDGLTDAANMAEYGRRIYTTTTKDPISGIPHLANPLNPDICTACGGYIPTLEENNCSQKK